MYLSDCSILELFGRFTTVCTVYYSALKYIFIWDVIYKSKEREKEREREVRRFCVTEHSINAV